MTQFQEKFMKNKEANLFLAAAALPGIALACMNPPVQQYERAALPGIFNLFVFLAIAYTSIKITPVLKNIMAVTALFPMTIYQAAEGLPEAIGNSVSFLFTALCFTYAYGDKERLGEKETLKLGIVLGVLFLFQNAFLWFGLLFFLIPRQKFGTKKEYIRMFVVAMLPLAVLGGFSLIGMFRGNSGGHAVVADGIAPLSVLMKKPDRAAAEAVRFLSYEIDRSIAGLQELSGSKSFWGPLLWLPPVFAVFTGCLDTYGAYQKIRRKDRLLGLAAFLLICAGVVANAYIEQEIHTAGTEFAAGLEGRSFIPALPVFFLAVSQKGIENKNKYFTEITIGIMGVMLLYAIFVTGLCSG